MANKGVPNPSFNGFMVNSAKANWNVVWIVYGSWNASEPMVDKEWTCFFHWNQSMDRHKTTYQAKVAKKKIGHSAMNTKIPFFWKRQMFDM